MSIVFKRKGRRQWHYKVRLANGTWRTRTGYTDKRATEKMASDEQAKIDRGEVGLVDPFADHRKKPLAEHLDDFAVALQGRNRTKKHISLTTTRLQAMLQAMDATKLDDLDLGRAERALGKLLQQAGRKGVNLSVKTRDHYAAALRGFGGWLVDAERIAVNPFRKLDQVATDADVRVERQALTGEQVQQLAAAAEQRPVQQYRKTHSGASAETLAKFAHDGRRRGLIYFAAALTGLRRGELAGLRWADLDLGERPTVLPRASTTKAKRRDPLPLDAGLAELLRQHRKTIAQETGRVPLPTDAVLHMPKNLTEQLRKDARWAGIPSIDDRGRRLDLHALRATYATLLANAGVPIQHGQRLIRHTDSRLTAKHYEKVAVEDLRPGIARLSAVFWGDSVAPQVAPNSVPQRAAVGCSVPLAEAGSAMAHQLQEQRQAGPTPPSAELCRSAPDGGEWWRRRESNPRPEMLRPGPLRA